MRKSHFLFGLAAAALAVVPAGQARADWPGFGGDPSHTLTTTEAPGAPLSVHWKFVTAPTDAGRGGNKAGPVVMGDKVFFFSRGRLHAVDANTGELKWMQPSEENQAPVVNNNLPTTPLAVNGMVFVPAYDGTLTAYNAEDGLQMWQVRTGGAIKSSPIVVGSNLYFGSDDDYLYCVDLAADGDVKWKSQTRLTDDVAASPVFHNGVVYVNTGDMKMWAFNADTGRQLWQRRVTSPVINISPVVHNGRVYLASGSTMYQFRARSGDYRAFPLGDMASDITTTPLITANTWYVTDRDGGLYAYNNVGKMQWKTGLDGRVVAPPVLAADGRLYVNTNKGFIYALNTERKGQIEWSYRAEPPKGPDYKYAFWPIQSPLAISNKRIYTFGDDGVLTAFGGGNVDEEGPVMAGPQPGRGFVINGYPPVTLSIYVWDEGSGLNPSTIQLELDGEEIAPDERRYDDKSATERTGWVYDPVRRKLTYTTTKPKGEKVQERPLAPGRHSLVARAADWQGNVTETKWTFVVDNNLPRNTSRQRVRRPLYNDNPASAPAAAPTNPFGGAAPGGFPGAPGYPGGGQPGMGQPGGYGYGGYGNQGYGQGRQGNVQRRGGFRR